MKFLLLCSFLLPSALAIVFAQNSAVITAQDVRDGRTDDLVTLRGRYRVYAVYTSSAINDVYASNVVIKGADNAQATIASLAKAKTGTVYVLDMALMTAPITITDTNPQPAAGIPAFLPFTIYIVSTTIAVAPVISAQLVNGPVNCNLAMLSSPSCTVLSAEQSTMIGGIDMTSLDSVYVTNVGFDAAWISQYTVMTVTKSSTVGSNVMISGPIATVFNSAVTPADLSFIVRRDGVWTGSFSAGARTSFLSNGFLSIGMSYNVDYANENVKWRSYYFDQETPVSFTSSIGNYFPPADTIDFTCTDGKGKKTIYDPANGDKSNLMCKSIEFHVVTTQAVGGPRFIVRVETGTPGQQPLPTTTLSSITGSTSSSRNDFTTSSAKSLSILCALIFVIASFFLG